MLTDPSCCSAWIDCGWVFYGRTTRWTISIDLPLEVDPSLLLAEIENEVSQWGAKVDYWVLPFLNVHAMVGLVDGLTECARSKSVDWN